MYFYFSTWISNLGYLFYGDIKRYKKKSKHFISYFDPFSIMYLSQVCIYILKFKKKDLQEKERMLILTPPEFINNFKKSIL